jgi:transposase InsO family protein
MIAEQQMRQKGAWPLLEAPTTVKDIDRMNVALGMIQEMTMALHPELQGMAKTAWELWALVHLAHSAAAEAEAILYEQEAALFRWQPGELIQAYVARAYVLFGKMDLAKVPVNEARQRTIVLTGVQNTPLQAVADSMVANGTELTMAKISAGLSYVQRAMLAEQQAAGGGALYAGRGPPPGPGRFNGNNRQRRGPGPDRGCFCCGELGHLAFNCPYNKSPRAMSGRNASTSGTTGGAARMATTAGASGEVDDDGLLCFVVDSGATDHMIDSCLHLVNYQALLKPLRIRLANDDVMYAEGKGDLFVDVAQRICLTNVLFVPGLLSNLLSVTALATKGCRVSFDDKAVVFYDKTDRPVIVGHRDGASYMVQMVPVRTAWAAQCQTTNVDYWHRRLGHIGRDGLSRMVRDDMVDGLPCTQEDLRRLPEFCDICVQSKQTRQSYGEVGRRVAGVLDAVHCDLCGPFPVASLGGARYYLSVQDEYTGFAELVFLTNKRAESIVAALQEVTGRWATLTSRVVKCLRSDHGTEFENGVMRRWCADAGILHLHSAPYTPEQNGRAERINRSVLERVRAFLVEGKLPGCLWGELARTACMVKNLVPAGDRRRTPWELMYGTKPDVSKLRVIGSTAWAHVPSSQRSKLQPVSQRLILVGYSPMMSAYRCLDPVTMKVYERSSVVVNEMEQPGVVGLGDPDRPGVLTFLRDTWVAQGSEEPLSSALPPAAVSDTAGEENGSAEDNGAQSDGDASGHEDSNHVPVDSGGGWMNNFSDSPVSTPMSEGTSAMHRSELEAFAESSPALQPLHLPDDVLAALPAVPLAAHWTAGGSGHVHSAAVAIAEMQGVTNLGGAALLAGMLGAEKDAPVVPRTLTEALASPQAEKWQEAMEEEIRCQGEHKTWELTELPSGAHALPCRWVFAVKMSADGVSVERYKARLVVKGFAQVEGVDYFDVYAPVCKFAALRGLLAIAAAQDLEVHHVDIKTAFLHAPLEEELYMDQPPGFKQGTKVCRLLKSVYGLKQAPRAWHELLKAELAGLGFKQSHSDPALFIREEPLCWVLVYVDDMLAVCRGRAFVINLISKTREVFELRDLGPVQKFVGFQVERNRQARTIKIHQSQMVGDLLSAAGFGDCKPNALPMQHRFKLGPAEEGTEVLQEQQEYASTVGSLLYLVVCTRPDLAVAVGILARHTARPGPEHVEALKGVLRYLQGTRNLGIVYRGGTDLTAYCDADLAAELRTARSTSGFVFRLGGSAFVWMSKRQPAVASSSTHAEYMAAFAACQEAIWVKLLMGDLKMPVKCVTICGDNQPMMHLLKQPVIAATSKHIEIKYHFTREQVMNGEVKFVFVRSEENLADGLTKPLARDSFLKFRQEIGMSA